MVSSSAWVEVGVVVRRDFIEDLSLELKSEM